ncbi:MAG TPA: YfiR family protein [Bacteroidales bacterium]|nr:YfiR family protein [Bacteroidales bacterium]
MVFIHNNLSPQSDINTLKAVAIEKIALFITWPPGSLSNQEFTIGILGDNPITETLKQIYLEKKIKDLRVNIVEIKDIESITSSCQLLFIPKIKMAELNKLLKHTSNKPILTISDTKGFAEAGCMINFYVYENKLRFELNQKGMDEAGFKIDYRLLKVSKIINPVIE